MTNTFASLPNGSLEFTTDSLNRTTAFDRNYGGSYPTPALLLSLTVPEGNKDQFDYDSRGNLTRKISKPKTGSGLADTITTATYPTSCVNRKTCNSPEFAVDANGGRTDYSYSPDHGGLLTVAAPTVAGIRPTKRFTYTQRYAWIKNSGGGYAQAATPVWVMTATKSCLTSATVGNSCAGGAADEAITEYDYGPDSGPNNLWVRGIVETARGVSLRTCYGYDSYGRKISETSPRAGLATCS
ncbi:hypothetical protein U1769_05105 [Sphingomonas sp. ZT3P38]|uniref:hypothetical protein n=1 Tax=Parasphingomonas zepuensis TaxID=3096161 RepID=UPI002FCA2FEE